MIQMPIPPLISAWSESIQYLGFIRKKIKTDEMRNSENKVLNVLPPAETGVEVQGSSYLLLLPCCWREDTLDGVGGISDSLCVVPGS